MDLPRLSGADSLVGSPWHCVKCAAEGEEGLRPFPTPLRWKEQLFLASPALLQTYLWLGFPALWTAQATIGDFLSPCLWHQAVGDG